MEALAPALAVAILAALFFWFRARVAEDECRALEGDKAMLQVRLSAAIAANRKDQAELAHLRDLRARRLAAIRKYAAKRKGRKA